MLSARGRQCGILWFKRGIVADRIVQMLEDMSDVMHQEEIISCARGILTELAETNRSGTRSLRQAISAIAEALAVSSADEVIRCVLGVLYSSLSDEEVMTVINLHMNRIFKIEEYSMAGILRAMEGVCGVLHGFVRLLLESQRMVCSKPSPMESYGFRLLV
jgi:hypothetical protein